MKKVNKILIIVQRSNGDVFLSSPLIDALANHYNDAKIDLLVNDDTLAIAKTLKHVKDIHLFSYAKKVKSPWHQEIAIIKTLYKKYDLSINLTASDRSVFYAILASSYSISGIDDTQKKSWWKKLLLNKSYQLDQGISIVENNMKGLDLLSIEHNTVEVKSNYTEAAKQSILQKLKEKNIKQFIVFHPSAQYDYKVYPSHLREKLLRLLDGLNVPIVVTGAKSAIDLRIKNELPDLKNLYDFIGETTLDEYIALSALSEAYIGMDTLNMHIAASQNKRVFAIFGPTILSIWSPWCNALQQNTKTNRPKQTYGNITIFQADMACVACGLAGCDDKHGKSDCLWDIDPQIIFEEVKHAYCD